MKPHLILLAIVSLFFIPEVIFIYKQFTKKISNINLPIITFKINILVFVFASVLLSIVILYDINYLNYKAPIEYNKWKEIEWSDFRAIKRPRQTLNGSENFAFICTEINCKYTKNTIQITTLFHPSRSYTFNKEVADQALLQHELYHLHITEYCSRLIRKSILNLDNMNDKERIGQIIDKYSQIENELQYQYDEESYHGFILGIQKKWQLKIDSCLLSMEAYSNPIINIK